MNHFLVRIFLKCILIKKCLINCKGVGGVSSGQDAYEKIKAGAKYIQLYTCFVYEGPLCAARIKQELMELLEKDGYNNYTEAIGKDVQLLESQ